MKDDAASYKPPFTPLSERSEQSQIRMDQRSGNRPEGFESLASCFAFRCSAALNITGLVQ